MQSRETVNKNYDRILTKAIKQTCSRNVHIHRSVSPTATFMMAAVAPFNPNESKRVDEMNDSELSDYLVDKDGILHTDVNQYRVGHMATLDNYNVSYPSSSMSCNC